MKLARTIFILHFTIILCACSGTGGTLGNLIPMPKFLDGEVKGDYYFPKNRSFKVMLPHPPSLSKKDAYEWTYTKVHENEEGEMTRVIFGGAAWDKNYYHIINMNFITPNKDRSLEEMRDSAKKTFLQVIKAQPYRKMHAQAEQLTFQDIIVNDRQGFYTSYQLGEHPQHLIAAIVFTHYGFYIVEVDTSWSSDNPEFDPTRETLINNNFKIFNRIVNSFEPLI